MKKAMLLICGVIFFVGCAARLNTTQGSKCEPKWYKNQEISTKEVVYGYSWEKSRNSSLAAKKGIAQAQSIALSQINQKIDDDVRLAIEEIGAKTGKEIEDDYREATLNELRVNTQQNCAHCVRVKFEDCEEDGVIAAYTMVEIDVNSYLDQSYMDKRNKLLEKSESLLDDLKKD